MQHICNLHSIHFVSNPKVSDRYFILDHQITRARTQKKTCNMSSLSPTDTILLALDSKELQRDISYLDQATLATKTRLLLALVDYQQASQPPTISTIDALAKCLDSSSRLKPMLDIVPLFPFLGWPHGVLFHRPCV